MSELADLTSSRELELYDRPVGIGSTQTKAIDVLVAAIQSGKLNKQQRYWITKKLSQVMEHETNLEIIRAYQNDPDLFYKLALIGGGAVAVLGAALSGMTDSIDKENNILPGGLILGDMMLIPAGLTLSGFSAFMLAFPRVFGPNGIQFKASGGGWGMSGEVELG